MTHIDNIPHVLEWGITHRRSSNANPHFITIGDISLIDTRSNKIVRVNNGDWLNFGADSIVLGEFIPFYFGTRMPMLYVIQHGGNFVEKATTPEDIIYLVCSLKEVVDSGITYYFSDGHATDKYSSFYDSEKIDELPEIVDRNVVKEHFWGGNENLITKRKKQAEFLLAEDLPAKYIIGMICYNETAKARLIEMGFEGKIKVNSKEYF